MSGLRERKKRRTRELIQREALRLFLEHGYEATTVEQIAAAADVSPSTFFNYFPTKEDVVLLDTYDPVIEASVLDRPSGESLADSLIAVLSGPFAKLMERDRDLILGRTRVMLDTPAVRARLWDELQRSEEFIRGVMAERTGRRADDFEVRVTAALLTGALFTTAQEWAANGGTEDFTELMQRAVRVIESGGVLGQATSSRAATTAPKSAQQGSTSRR